ncbi:hypothetical protein M5K25_010959 [Dendrobium thyrsiflorum]|uniref:Uncharacterized protein n=1 Tax=Dendrobium thyrsiflorum TaxID=117978 RepID=A0ABD0V8G9_DENTH
MAKQSSNNVDCCYVNLAKSFGFKFSVVQVLLRSHTKFRRPPGVSPIKEKLLETGPSHHATRVCMTNLPCCQTYFSVGVRDSLSIYLREGWRGFMCWSSFWIDLIQFNYEGTPFRQVQHPDCNGANRLSIRGHLTF